MVLPVYPKKRFLEMYTKEIEDGAPRVGVVYPMPAASPSGAINVFPSGANRRTAVDAASDAAIDQASIRPVREVTCETNLGAVQIEPEEVTRGGSNRGRKRGVRRGTRRAVSHSVRRYNSSHQAESSEMQNSCTEEKGNPLILPVASIKPRTLQEKVIEEDDNSPVNVAYHKLMTEIQAARPFILSEQEDKKPIKIETPVTPALVCKELEEGTHYCQKADSPFPTRTGPVRKAKTEALLFVVKEEVKENDEGDMDYVPPVMEKSRKRKREPETPTRCRKNSKGGKSKANRSWVAESQARGDIVLMVNDVKHVFSYNPNMARVVCGGVARTPEQEFRRLKNNIACRESRARAKMGITRKYVRRTSI